MRVSAVVPSFNGVDWLRLLIPTLRAQSRPLDELVVVDNGSDDETVAWLAAEVPEATVVALEENRGFAGGVNAGIAASSGDAVALINNDVELGPDWVERMVAALERAPRAGSVACKMVSAHEPGVIDDAGDVLRRDGACVQRGRGRRDTGLWDAPGEIWGACAGAALYRRAALDEAGPFDERYFAYLEDVEVALRLRRAGWSCVYEPAVARHVGGASGALLFGTQSSQSARNSLLLAARHFRWSWAPMVAYRQASWIAEAARERRLVRHLRIVAGAAPLLPAMWRERGPSPVPVEVAVPAVPWRGPAAGGHPESPE